MINAIAELGQYEKSIKPDISSFDIWLEDSFDNGKNPNLFLIKLKRDDDLPIYRYHGIDVWENSSKLKSKLLYKRHASRGADKTPTGKVSEKIETSFQQKILGWFTANSANKLLTKEQQGFLADIGSELKDKSELIVSDLKHHFFLVDKKGVVLSVLLDEAGEEKFIGDFDFSPKFITAGSEKSYKYKHNTFSFFGKKHCSICKMKKEEVFGFFSSLAFYTVDKPGMVTGGFRQTDSWKNYPVCLDCALDVEMGIKMMERQFDFTFYGLRYYLIPKTINKSAKNKIIDVIIDYKRSPKVGDSDRRKLTNAKDEVFALLMDKDNRLSFNLVFYDKPKKGEFKILSSIEEVLPSKIRRLFAAKDWVDNLCFFKDHLNDEGKPLFRFNFGVLRDFFPSRKTEGNHDKSFLMLTSKIFNGSGIEYQFVVRRIIDRIRSLFTEDGPFWFQAMQGFMLVNFMNALNLFQNIPKENKMDQTFFEEFKIDKKETFEEKVKLFFTKFSDFFTHDAHRGIFLMGVLAQFLLNIQRNGRNAAPFRSRLKGLKMNARDISFLLPDIIEKIERYKKQYGGQYQYKNVADLTSKYLISAGNYNNWRVPIDEMNFIFVLGMNLSRYFKIQPTIN
ncbi:MAG: TIGR02556 family CRISPR-associated protein [Deltaproteobacteria bacterium]|nr:TIGR02556 family CRISPR-associated protein [Deltaproteobacteria bacterium]